MSFLYSAAGRRLANSSRRSVWRFASSTNNIETTGISLDMILEENRNKSRNTKIICTIGPACWSHGELLQPPPLPPVLSLLSPHSSEGLLGLIDNGMNLARLNFSHGDHEGHGRTVQRLREAAKERPDSHVGIMVDIKGPGLRTGLLDPSLGGKLTLNTGDELEMGTVRSAPSIIHYVL